MALNTWGSSFIANFYKGYLLQKVLGFLSQGTPLFLHRFRFDGRNQVSAKNREE